MNQIRKYTAWLGAGAIMLTLATGCADRNQNGVPESPATTGEINNTTANEVNAAGNVADATGDALTNGAAAVGNGAETAAEATGNVASAAGDNLGALADAATMTPKVKTALGANTALKGSKINVDTLGKKDTIALRGSVTSMAQKSLAESIAKREAPGYKIDNQLKMGGAM